MSIYQEENTGTSENGLGRRENLPNRYQCDIPNISAITCHANPQANCLRKCIQHIDRRVKPSPQSLISDPRLLELVDLVLKYGQNVRGGVACSELAGERMGDEIFFGFFFICVEGFVKNGIEIGRGYCRCGIRLTHVH